MFYCPYSPEATDDYRESPMTSFIRILHASPNAPPVDIYGNDKLIAANIAYREFSEYLPVPPGNYNIKVYPAGQKVNPVIDTNLNVPPVSIFNVAVIGLLPNISLYPIPSPTMPHMSGKACVRFIHLSPNAPAVDVTLPNGTKLFSNVSYKGITTYSCVPRARYTLQVRPVGTNEVVLTVPNVNLMPNRYYSIYAVGLTGGAKPPLQVLISLDSTPNAPR